MVMAARLEILPHQFHASSHDKRLPSKRTLVLGIGGFGCKAATYILDNTTYDVQSVLIDTNAQDLERVSHPNKLLLGEKSLKGLGTGLNPRLGAQVATQAQTQLKELFKGFQLMIVTAGAGGGTGGGMLSVIQSIAREMNLTMLPMLTMPFILEGKLRQDVARIGIEELKPSSFKPFIISQQALLHSHPNASFKEALLASCFTMLENMETLLKGMKRNKERLNTYVSLALLWFH